MECKKLTEEEKEARRKENTKTLEEYERRRREEFNDPERVKRREWIKEIFNGDLDQIAHFAATLMQQADVSQKENEALVEKLNRIHSMAFGLSSDESKAEPHVRYNIARLSLEWDRDDPIAKTFLSAMKIEKTLTARRRANKGHASRVKAKAFVQSEWLAHKGAYEENKSAFARDYVRRCSNEYGVTVTEKQMREVWLKDTPSASKPDGLLAGGE